MSNKYRKILKGNLAQILRTKRNSIYLNLWLRSSHIRVHNKPFGNGGLNLVKVLKIYCLVFRGGDFDYSGIGILSALRKIFITLKAWQPGYVPMLVYLAQGIPHKLAEVGKAEQKDPCLVGCDYSDAILLPYMKEHYLFLAQEAVDVSDCLTW